VPHSVWLGFYAVHSTDPSRLVSWVATLRRVTELGYPETASWIEENLTKLYAPGIDRGFVSMETGEMFLPSCYPIGN
jgi:hypothetical protein